MCECLQTYGPQIIRVPQLQIEDWAWLVVSSYKLQNKHKCALRRPGARLAAPSDAQWRPAAPSSRVKTCWIHPQNMTLCSKPSTVYGCNCSHWFQHQFGKSVKFTYRQKVKYCSVPVNVWFFKTPLPFQIEFSPDRNLAASSAVAVVPLWFHSAS